MESILTLLNSNIDDDQFWKDTRESLLSAIRLFVKVGLGMLVAAFIADYFNFRDHLASLYAAKLIAVAVIMTILAVLRTQWGQEHAELVTLMGAIAVLLTIAYQSNVIGDVFMMSIVTAFGTMISATMLPWRIGYHITGTFISLANIFIVVYLIRRAGITQPIPEFAGSLILASASIPLAILINQHRFALWKTQRALRESEGRFRQIAENSRDIILTWSLDRKIEYISPSYERFTGRSPDEIYKNIFLVADKIVPEDRAGFREALESILSGNFVKMEMRIRHTNGTKYHFEGWGSPIRDPQGDIVRCIGIWHDITERVQMVNDLDAYAHSVAHDLKNPIALLVSYVDLIPVLEVDVPDELEEPLDAIIRNAYRMIDIIDSLLLLAHLRSNEEVNITPIEMGELVNDVLDRLTKVVQDSGAEIKQAEKWHAAQGYAPWIEEIWSNYISNAIKYGGQPPLVEVGSDAKNGNVRFWVRDNGSGMSKEDSASLFTEFSRLAQHSKIEGHGLGLSIVQRIAEKLGGQVGVESEEGKGSTFYFELPLAK